MGRREPLRLPASRVILRRAGVRSSQRLHVSQRKDRARKLMGGGSAETLTPGRQVQRPEEDETLREHRAPCKANPAHRATDSAEVPGPEGGQSAPVVVDGGTAAHAASADNARAAPHPEPTS
jgi:hypothetical protein